MGRARWNLRQRWAQQDVSRRSAEFRVDPVPVTGKRRGGGAKAYMVAWTKEQRAVRLRKERHRKDWLKDG